MLPGLVGEGDVLELDATFVPVRLRRLGRVGGLWFFVEDVVDAFCSGEGRLGLGVDLRGQLDGTEELLDVDQERRQDPDREGARVYQIAAVADDDRRRQRAECVYGRGEGGGYG